MSEASDFYGTIDGSEQSAILAEQDSAFYSDAAGSNNSGILDSLSNVFTNGLEAWVDIETLDRRLEYQAEVQQLEANPNTGKSAPLPVGQTNYLTSASTLMPTLLIGGGLLVLAKMAKVF